MKPFLGHFFFKAVFLLCAFVFVGSVAGSANAANTIGGFIFDKVGTPLSDIDVELLDEYHRIAKNGTARMKTDGSGRYEFNDLNEGWYTVRVYAFRYDLDDAEQTIEIKSVSALPGQPGSSYNPLDFHLRPRKGGIKELELGVVFTQDVPRAAESAFKQAVEDLKNKRNDEGFNGLKKAINLYPNYFAALMKFGAELLVRGQFFPAAQTYLKAGQVNPKAAVTYYYAGYALQKSGPAFNKSAHTALEEALRLAPGNVLILLRIADVERKLGLKAEAEAHLLTAKKAAAGKYPDVNMSLAELYNDLKRYKDAADELEAFLRASKLSDPEVEKTKKLIADLRAKAAKTPGTLN